MTYQKFWVVGLWGQSNAVGYDESLLTEGDKSRDESRILQYSNALKPLSYAAEHLQNMNLIPACSETAAAMGAERAAEGEERQQYVKTKGLALPLANLLLDSVPEDYGIIIVPAGYGGASLCYLKKGSETGFYSEFIRRMQAALSLNPANIMAGIIWCQGESDAMMGTVAASYQASLEQLISSVNSDLAAYQGRHGKISKSDWYFFEWPKFFQDLDKNGILARIRAVFGDNYIPIPLDTPTNRSSYTSAYPAAHYGQNAFSTVIAPLVAARMLANRSE